MIQNNQELIATIDRIKRFSQQVDKIREIETNPRNCELSAGGFQAEINRMGLEVLEYLSIYPDVLIKVLLNIEDMERLEKGDTDET